MGMVATHLTRGTEQSTEVGAAGDQAAEAGAAGVSRIMVQRVVVAGEGCE
jgi:hypothetical protein